MNKRGLVSDVLIKSLDPYFAPAALSSKFMSMAVSFTILITVGTYYPVRLLL